MRILAIDPGAKGGFVLLDDNELLNFYQFTDDKEASVKNLTAVAQSLLVGDIVVREDVHSMPNQGVVSTFTFGYNTGMLDGWAYTQRVPMKKITPQSWHKLLMMPAKVPQHIAKRIGPMCIRENGYDVPVTAEGVGDAFLIALAVWKRENKMPHKFTKLLDFDKLVGYASENAKKRAQLTVGW